MVASSSYGSTSASCLPLMTYQATPITIPRPTIPPITPRTMTVVLDFLAGVGFGVGPGDGPGPGFGLSGSETMKLLVTSPFPGRVAVTVTFPEYPATLVPHEMS